MGYEESRKKRMERDARYGKKKQERAPEKPKVTEPYKRPITERFDGSRSKLEARIGVTRVPDAVRTKKRADPIRIEARPRKKLSHYGKGGVPKKDLAARARAGLPAHGPARDGPRLAYPRDGPKTYTRTDAPRAEERDTFRQERPSRDGPRSNIRDGIRAGRGTHDARPSDARSSRPVNDERRPERPARPALPARFGSRVPNVIEKKPFKPRFSRRTEPRKTKIEPPKPIGAPERVQKLIAAAGLASRREAERWIEENRVQVNGVTIKLGDSATRKDKVTVNGAPITFPKTVYIMLHKPKGYVTTRKDIYGNKTVMELVASDERLYPVGRLDKDTTGLLLMTNDGEFANRVMHPRYEIEKTYVATLDKPFATQDLQMFARGVHLKEGIVVARVRIISPRRVEVKLHQGYNHVVKRIMKGAGYFVRDLVRTHVGGLELNIPEGAYRPLNEKEVALLLAPQPGPRPSPKTPKGTPSAPSRPRAH